MLSHVHIHTYIHIHIYINNKFDLLSYFILYTIIGFQEIESSFNYFDLLSLLLSHHTQQSDSGGGRKKVSDRVRERDREMKAINWCVEILF